MRRVFHDEPPECLVVPIRDRNIPRGNKTISIQDGLVVPIRDRNRCLDSSAAGSLRRLVVPIRDRNF